MSTPAHSHKNKPGHTPALQAPTALVQETLRSPGQPLDAGTRAFFEPRLGHALSQVSVNPIAYASGMGESARTLKVGKPDTLYERQAQRVSGRILSGDSSAAPAQANLLDLSHVRVHADPLAAASARSVGAAAYTVGSHIVFGQGQYAPHSQQGRALLAHELVHVDQQARTGSLMLQRQPQAGAPQAAPRPVYVFIMGQDPRRTRNPFYRIAERYYRAHIRNAHIITNLRSMNALLSYIATNVTQPIGDLYIITHANEDGTLSFGLSGTDADSHMEVRELRSALHPAGGGASTLTQLGNQIDAQTRILIKGCDLGRTQEMVELIDEAFGGAGTVIAPTHEQGFNLNPTLAQQERERQDRQRMTAFEATLAPISPVPAPVDPALRGPARQQATRQRQQEVRARQQAIQQRQRDIAQERRRIAPEVQQAGEVAGLQESLSGPMFQRPGTQLFTAAEIRPQVGQLYPHLSVERQSDITRRLVAPDQRRANVAERQGTFQQQGQRLYTRRPYSYRFAEPQNTGEANRQFQSEYPRGFRANNLITTRSQHAAGGTLFTFEIEGTIPQRRGPAQQTSLTFSGDPVPENNTMITQGRAGLNNPDRYAWRVARNHASSGITTFTTIAERVVAYLHHGSLDPGANRYFNPPLTDPRFYATSSFSPPPPPPAGGGAQGGP